MSHIGIEILHTPVHGSSWVSAITWSNGVLSAELHGKPAIRWARPRESYRTLLERTKTKRDQNGRISAGSAVSEFVQANREYNLENLDIIAEANLDLLSKYELQALYRAIMKRNLHRV